MTDAKTKSQADSIGKKSYAPSGGTGRWQFRDREDLVDYVAGAFGIEPVSPGIFRASGAQLRASPPELNLRDRRVLFDDQILDLITSTDGVIEVGGVHYDMRNGFLHDRGNTGGLAAFDSNCVQHPPRASNAATPMTAQPSSTTRVHLRLLSKHSTVRTGSAGRSAQKSRQTVRISRRRKSTRVIFCQLSDRPVPRSTEWTPTPTSTFWTKVNGGFSQRSQRALLRFAGRNGMDAGSAASCPGGANVLPPGSHRFLTAIPMTGRLCSPYRRPARSASTRGRWSCSRAQSVRPTRNQSGSAIPTPSPRS